MGDPIGLTIGLVGLAGQLYQAVMTGYDILSDAQDVGTDHDSFGWQLVTEKNRLIRWEKMWGVDNGTLNQKLDPNDYRYRYAVGTLARIVALFASAEDLNLKYGLQVVKADKGPPRSSSPNQRLRRKSGSFFRRSSSPLPSPNSSRSDRLWDRFPFLSIRPRGDEDGRPGSDTGSASPTRESPPPYSPLPSILDPKALQLLENPSVLQSENLIPGLEDEIRKLKETASRMERSLPIYRKLTWAVIDKPRSIELIKTLRTYNDGLYNVLPAPDALLQEEHFARFPSSRFPKFRVPISLPVQRNHQFSGREDLLEKIHSILKPDIPNSPTTTKRCVAVLYGLGGMGKSQTSIEYAYRYPSSYTSIFMVDATSQATLSQSAFTVADQLVSHYKSQWGNARPDFNQLGVQLGLSGCIDRHGRLLETSSPQLIVKAVRKWLSEAENTDWLVVFDNHDDIETVTLENFVPTVDFGKVIITTRRPEVKHFGIGVEVGEIGKEAGIEILLSSAGKDPKNAEGADLEEAKEIAEKLGYLPLALDQAGGYISAMQIPLAGYLPLYETNFKRVASANNLGLSKRYRNDTFFTTWKISFDSLPPLASKLLLLCAFLGDQDISEEIILKARSKIPWLNEDDDLTHDAILPLLSISLAKRKGTSGTFSFHPLVLEWARASLNKTEQRKKATEAIIVVGKSVTYPRNSKELADWVFEQRIYPYIDVAYRNIKKYFSDDNKLNLEIAVAILSVGIVYRDYGNYDAAEKLHLKAFSVYEKKYGMEHIETLRVVHGLGRIYDSRGKYGEALEWYGKALVGFEKTCGKQDAETMGTVGNMAVVFQNQGKYAEALEWNKRALEGYQKALGDGHPETLLAMNNIAVVFQSQAKYDKAGEWYARALVGYEKILGKEHPETLRTVHNTAFVFYNQGKYEEALEWYKRALDGREKTLGKEHPETMSTVVGIAIVYRNQARYEEALECYQRALASKEKILGNQHPETLGTVDNISVVYLSQGRYDEALKWNSRAVAGYEKALGPQHPETTRAIHNMALILSNQGKYDEALECYRRSLEGSEKSLGKGHPDTLGTIVGMAFIFQLQGKYKEAMEWNMSALAGYEAVLGKEHPETLLAVNNMAFALQKQEKYSEALEYYKRALDGRVKVLGKEHPDTLHTYYNMALVFRLNGQYDQALENYKQAHVGYVKAFGPEHPDTLDTMHDIALLYQLDGKHQEAVERYEVVLAHREKALGKDHAMTQLTANNLAAARMNVN